MTILEETQFLKTKFKIEDRMKAENALDSLKKNPSEPHMLEILQNQHNEVLNMVIKCLIPYIMDKLSNDPKPLSHNNMRYTQCCISLDLLGVRPKRPTALEYGSLGANINRYLMINNPILWEKFRKFNMIDLLQLSKGTFFRGIEFMLAPNIVDARNFILKLT